MSLVSRYKNIKLESKLLINLFVILFTFLLIIAVMYFYLNRTFLYIDEGEKFIENYTLLNKNTHNYYQIQNYISESIISLNVNEKEWHELQEASNTSLAALKTYINTQSDSLNYEIAKKNFNAIVDLYNKNIIPNIVIAQSVIADTSYTDFSINKKLSDLLNESNVHFDKINQSFLQIKQNSISRVSLTYESINSNKNIVFLVLIISVFPLILFLFFFFYVFKNSVILEIQRIIETLQSVALGDVMQQLEVNSDDEIGFFKRTLNKLLLGLLKITAFAKEIENGNFDSDFEPRSTKDELGIALLDMRKSLKDSKLKEIENQKEDEKRNWAANEISKYSDILRKNNNDLSKLANDIILNLINTLNANQGGIFIVNDENKYNVTIELIASYAYDRKKYYTKIIQMGEGLVGTCAIEKETIYLKEIPENYIEIISGLGNSNPRNLILVPLKLEDKILGVVEIASFYEFEDYKIAFLEKVAENIAATLATAKINAKTALLLVQSQQQAEELASQEEEMRQNMEELQATQEEAARQAVELKGVFDAINENTGTIQFSPDGTILDANDYILKLLRIKMSMVSKKHHSTILTAEEKDSDEFYDFWQDIRAGETKFITRRYFVAQQELWLHEIFKPLYDNGGKLYKVLAMYSNMTDSEVQKRKMEEQSAELLEYQEKMKLNQEELKKTNDMLEVKSGILKKALETSKAVEKELNEKNKLMLEQEDIMKESLESLALAHEEMGAEREHLQAKITALQLEKEQLSLQLNQAIEEQKQLQLKIDKLKKQ